MRIQTQESEPQTNVKRPMGMNNKQGKKYFLTYAKLVQTTINQVNIQLPYYARDTVTKT